MRRRPTAMLRRAKKAHSWRIWKPPAGTNRGFESDGLAPVQARNGPGWVGRSTVGILVKEGMKEETGPLLGSTYHLEEKI